MSATSCDSKLCFHNSDALITDSITFEGVENYEFNDVFEIKLVQDTTDKIIITADENNISSITFEQIGNRLYVDNKGNCDFIRGKKNIPELEIHAINIDTILVYEYCKIKSLNTLKFMYFNILYRTDIGYCDINIRNRQLRVSAWTLSGEYRITGDSDFVSLSASGVSEIYADSLTTDCLWIVHNSSKVIKANVSDSLSVFLLNQGNLYLGNEPNKIFEKYILATGTIIYNN